MDLVTGALAVLPSKLLELLKDEYKLQKGVKEQVRALSQELDSMHAAIRKVAAVPWDQLDDQIKVWAREVRDASYDMEDVLDTFLVRAEAREPTDPSMIKRAMKKMGDLFRKAKARHDIAGAIEDIKNQLQEVTERRSRYWVDDLVAKTTAATCIDPRLSALYTKVSQLIGIDEARDKLIKMLTTEDDRQTKIVSVVGFGGLGKTTLAKTVYRNLTEDVDFKAFVPVGRNPDLKKVLKDILIGLDKKHYTMEFNLTTFDERQLIDELQEFLKDKRYFIVIDDIWDISSWSTIRYALDDNSLGSKIVVTTRNHDVAEKVGCYYKMEPLPYESSKLLFYGRIFGSKGKCPKQLFEVSEKIMKKCGGVPLAIITTASLLANKSGNINEWYELCDSIGLGLGSNHHIDTMRKILSFSYYDLPSHLKICLLYLSIFPEDYAIGKDRLIWKWIAEDFVSHGEGNQSLFEIGESYFNELLNRNLIQQANIMEEVGPRLFNVHDMVLDLLCSLSREENFVTVVLGDNKQNTPCFGSMVRRLSLHNTTWPTMDVSRMRSLVVFNDATIDSMPSLSCYHLLRVLDLSRCNLKNLPCLRFVGNLLHLRYLGLSHTLYAGKLPVEIGKLQFLQTLDLFGTEIKELPSSLVELRKLMSLYVDKGTKLPNGLRKLTSLELLGNVMVDSSSSYILEELGHLTQLRALGVHLKKDEEGGTDGSLSLLKSLAKLHKIQTLSIVSGALAIDLEGSVATLGNLCLLFISQTRLFPTWISPVSLPLLSILFINVDQLRTEDISLLGMLPVLRELQVIYRNMQVLEKFVVGADAFPFTRVCIFSNFSTVPSMFPCGAMPSLEQFEFHIRLEDFSGSKFIIDDLALGHLASLQRVHLYLHGMEKVNKEVVMEVKKKLSHEVDIHPNYPYIRIYE
ncbi:unnamed protein product [Urochloa humidicola]